MELYKTRDNVLVKEGDIVWSIFFEKGQPVPKPVIVNKTSKNWVMFDTQAACDKYITFLKKANPQW